MEGLIRQAVISDLFFNLDLAECKTVDDRGDFVEFDRAKLADEAEWFLESLTKLGVRSSLPSTDELVGDFLRRV